MKKVFIYISAIFGLASCGLLEEKVTTSLTDGYGSESVLEMQIRAILAGMDYSSHYTGYPMYSVYAGSGLTQLNPSSGSSQATTDNDYTGAKRFSAYASANYNNYHFRYNYRGIDQCNNLLEGLKTSPVADAYKLEIEAEAKFLRAFLYFNVVRLWGDVPMPLTPSVAGQTNIPRTKYDKVFCQVVEDLKFAEQHMRTQERAEEVSPGDGRPCKWAATAYLSSVYLHIGSLLAHPDDNFWDNTKPERCPDFSSIGINTKDDAFRLSLAKAKELIPASDGGEGKGPYRLATKFSDLFKWTDGYVTADGCDCWSLPERIFVLNITPQASTARLSSRTLPNYVAGTKQVTNSNTHPGEWRPDRFLFQTWCEKYPGTKGKSNFADIWATSSDPRLDVTFYHTTIATQKNGEAGTFKCYPNSSSTKPTHENSMPYFKKYFSSGYNADAGYADLYFMRLAEMYLNAAECEAWLGDFDAAKNFIEPLHKRARAEKAGSEQPDWKDRTWGSAEELVTDIFWERVFELIGEGYHDWFDTHRFGAKWLTENISKPKKAFLELKEQSSDTYASKYGTYKSIYNGTWEYCEDWNTLRAGLLNEFPYTEYSNNSAIGPEGAKNDFNY